MGCGGSGEEWVRRLVQARAGIELQKSPLVVVAVTREILPASFASVVTRWYGM